ncbi:ATP-binding cassette domain-containing protein [Fructilactobacillus sanfranciscensis]|uniref:ATP-binding cassette domain-containing protein n=1 Tax=Fructilactobacillus sanfranciscensis TaxID=1625 RepID=UPI0013D1D173|nr:ABC transporter ATP-binding protein [Fructilactobacillus sanfranciscensis]
MRFGFLGHNGAGKSTTLKSLTSIIEPTSGKISFDGLDLADNLDTPIQDMSHGMQEKNIIIGTLLVNPEVWILDEPIQGLDPQAAFNLKQVMKAHAEQGKTGIFSTHVLDTAQQLCDEIAILKNGEMIFNGSVKSLLEAHPKESLETIYLNLIGRKNNQSEIEQLEGDSHAE